MATNRIKKNKKEELLGEEEEVKIDDETLKEEPS
jgi:hypothetical protein